LIYPSDLSKFFAVALSCQDVHYVVAIGKWIKIDEVIAYNAIVCLDFDHGSTQ